MILLVFINRGCTDSTVFIEKLPSAGSGLAKMGGRGATEKNKEK